MTTMSDLVNRTRSLSSGSMTDVINLLAQPYTPGDNRLTFAYPAPNIAPGMILSADLNVFYVGNTSSTTSTVEVLPSPNGEPNEPLPAGTLVRAKPRFTDWQIFTLLNDQISLMTSPMHGLYRIVTWEDRVDPAWNTYQVPAEYVGMVDMLRVRHKVVGSPDQWTDLRQWSIQHNSEGGSVIRIFQKDIQFGDVEFVARAPLAPATSLASDLITDCGLADTMIDIPMLGAASYLILSSESQRVHLRAQGDSRRPDEVPVDANSKLSGGLLFRRDRRIAEEYARLVARTAPVTGRW